MDCPPTELSPLSLHDALPISIVVFSLSTTIDFARPRSSRPIDSSLMPRSSVMHLPPVRMAMSSSIALRRSRSEEHTSELQSPCNLVCRLLLEKKNHIRPHHKH